MKISQALENKRVKVICIDGEVFEGTVADYIYPEDNEPEGIAAIDLDDCLQRPKTGISLNEDEIEKVEIL